MSTSKDVPLAELMALYTNETCDPTELTLSNEQRSSQSPEQLLLPRFALGQEAFILDKSGTEQTGLATYLVLTNHEKDAAGRVLYRLMPSQEIVFRAAETRLLEIKFPMGAQVKRTGDQVCSVVTKRHVVRGMRVYELRDEMGRLLQGVKEEELNLCDGGNFPFVTNLKAK